MIDQIISSVKGELAGKLQHMGMPADKAPEAVDLAKKDIMDQFAKEAGTGNLSGIQSLFNGRQDIGSSSIVQSTISRYSGTLMSKLGLNPDMADKIARFAIPFVMSRINDKTPADGIGTTELMGMLKSKSEGTAAKGLKDKLGGLFR